MSSFQALYGYKPPHLIFPVPTTTSVASVESYLKERNVMLQLLKDDLTKAQDLMKFYAEKKRQDREFSVTNLVFLKLQPYRHSSVAVRKNFKLSAKYFGPFEVLKIIGAVANKLQLPMESKIHHVFHVSQLKKHIGLSASTLPQLPVVDDKGHYVVKSVAVLATHLTLEGKVFVPQILVHLSNSAVEDATWEDISHLKAQFPHFILEDKDLSREGQCHVTIT
ncbi:uncharacterized protein LOC113333568 [Papaver somniferum]|uniref:uncharacterized protein LOC113333568 n=1 Tax=Papaver somniferum TaxID=3469 RepID=UPI000E6FC3BC|nr:uncharacterized protein LOC113333568 [Papaver somniferum]